MKLSEIIQNSDSFLSVEKPILANVDPENIPVEVVMTMTPTLEEPEEKVPEFPENYTHDRLDLSVVQQLKRTCESLEYVSQAAANQAELIHDSMELTENGDVSDLSSRIIRSQIVSALSLAPEITRMPECSRKIEEGLDKLLTSRGPYNRFVSMEALSVTLDTLKPLILKGLQTSKGLSHYIQKNGNLDGINKQLTVSFELMKTADVNKDPSQMQAKLASVYPKILDAVKSGFSPDQVPNQIQLDQGALPVTACVCIARGLSKIKFQAERGFSSTDIKPVSEYLQFSIQVLQLLTGNLQHTSDILGQSPTTESSKEGNKEQPSNQSVKVDGDLSRQILAHFTAFFQTVRGMSAHPGATFGDTQSSGEPNEKEFAVMPGWPGVVLKADDDTDQPVVAGREQIATIGYKDVSDLITLTQSQLLPKLAEVFRLTKVNEALIAKILEQLNSSFNGRTDDVQTGRLYQTAVVKLLQAVKLSTKLVLSSSHAVLAVSEACIDISRGIGIIVDTH